MYFVYKGMYGAWFTDYMFRLYVYC